MTLALTNAIDDTQTLIEVTGTVGAEIEPNYLFRLDDEILQLRDFARAPITGDISDPTRVGRDVNQWLVTRGRSKTAAAAHLSGVDVLGVVDAFVSGDDEDEPAPFPGAGSVTPAAYVEPTTATPEAIANALIAAGLMDGPP